MSETPNTNTTPPKVLTFKMNDTDREVMMSYGLLNELVSLVGDIEEIAKFYVNEELRNKVLVAVLSERTPAGKVTNRISPEDVEIDIEVIDEMLSWAASHVTGFFIRSLTNLAEKMRAFPTEALTPQGQPLTAT